MELLLAILTTHILTGLISPVMQAVAWSFIIAAMFSNRDKP